MKNTKQKQNVENSKNDGYFPKHKYVRFMRKQSINHYKKIIKLNNVSQRT